MKNILKFEMSDLKSGKNKIELPNTVRVFFPTLLALLFISIFTAIFSETFLTSRNLLNVINQAATNGIMAVGATFIMVSGFIDLSCGAAVAFCGYVGANLCTNMGVDPFIAIFITIGLGLLIGLLNGYLVSVVGLSSFIVTLATMNVLKGLTLMYSKTLSVSSIPSSFTMWGSSQVFGVIPSGIIITLTLFIIGYIIMSRTVFGHRVYAMGGNREAAFLAGINVKKTSLLVYMIAGVCYGIAAVVLTGRCGAAYPTAADGTELDVIAGIVIGGTAMTGGRGSHIGTFIGILLVAVINNAINLLEISAFATKLVQGVVILLAVSVEVVRDKIVAHRIIAK